MRKILSLGVFLFLVSLLCAQTSVLKIENDNSIKDGIQYAKNGYVKVKPQPVSHPRTRSAVLYEDFTSTTFPPSGWTKIDGTESTGAQHWNRATNLTLGSSEVSIEGPVAFINWTDGNGASNQDEWLITPQITVPANSFLKFEIYTLMRYMVAGAGSEAGDGNNGDFNLD